MEDDKIVGLFLERDEMAIAQTSEKYGPAILKLSKRITGSEGAADECLNDTLLSLWKNIPPALPRSLGAYALKTARNLSFKRLRHDLAEKRSINSQLPLDELEAAICDEKAYEAFSDAELSAALDGFLRSLSPEARAVFLKRYFFADTVPEIAKDLGISQSKVNSILWRARNKLKAALGRKGAEK